MLFYVFKSLLLNIYENYKKSERIYKGLKSLNKDILLKLKELGFKPNSLFILSIGEIKDFFNTEIQKINFELFKQASFSFKNLSPTSFKFILSHIDSIQSWLASAKFKKLYLETKHPYPPLFDCELLQRQEEAKVPNSLSYADIEADIAWDLNLTLPRSKIKFLCLIRPLTGHTAFVHFLKLLNLNIVIKAYSSSCEQYIHFFNALKSSLNSAYVPIFYFGYEEQDLQKAMVLLSSLELPMLCLCRDPINQIKTGVNHQSNGNHPDSMLNLSYDFHPFISYIVYLYGGKDRPKLKLLSKKINYSLFLYQSLTQHFKQLYYIDVEEFSKEKAFDTFQKLALQFNFKPPKEDQKRLFESKMYAAYFMMLPRIIYVHEDDLNKIYHKGRKALNDPASLSKEGGFNIEIATRLFEKNPHYNQNCSFIFCDDYTYWEQDETLSEVGIFMNEEDFKSLSQNKILFEASKKYLNVFMKTLKAEILKHKNAQINQAQIVNYLKQKSNFRRKIKSLCDKELIHLKQTRPDIIASWKYYNEVEKICEQKLEAR